MHYTDYLEHLLQGTEQIYIDTCSLMYTERLEKFIFTSKSVFKHYNIQIIVPGSVQNELIDFLDSGDFEKKMSAEKAFMYMDEHHELFHLADRTDCGNFADPEILAELMRNKGKCRQLFITNDRKLAKDAFQLNLQESNFGKRIMVCHLNYSGILCRCECTKTQHQNPEQIVSNSVLNTKPITEVPRTVDQTTARKQRWKLPAAVAGGLAGGFVTGVVFDRYAVPLIRKALTVAA